MDKPSIDLVGLCRRMIFAWQYIDTKMPTDKLIAIKENCPYPKNSELTLPTNAPESLLETLTCTKYFLEEDLSTEFAMSHRYERGRITTAKTFFGQNEEFKNMAFKERQFIYWMIRLRYACGIVPIALLKMVGDLKKLGYKSWTLPTGDTIPISEIWLGDLVVIPNQYHVVCCKIKLMGSDVRSIVEPIEAFAGVADERPFSYHSVILMNLKSVVPPLCVLDPTSLQFGMDTGSGLITCLPWDRYVKKFPGKIIQACLENDADASLRLQQKWEIGNRGFDHCKKLIKAVIKDINLSACNNCGNIESNSNGQGKLSNCGGCKIAKYCDKLCQKSDWKCHKTTCSAKKDQPKADS